MRVMQQAVIKKIIQLVRDSNLIGISMADLEEEELLLSRQQIIRYLKVLIEQNKIERRGKGKATRYFYKDELNILISKTMPLGEALELGEDIVYEQYITSAPQGFSKNIKSILKHGFTEMVNNAIDHSLGQKLSFALKENQKEVILDIEDDGVGIFKKNMVVQMFYLIRRCS